MAPKKENVEVYRIILDMIMKFIFSIVVIGVFVYIIIKFFTITEWSQTVPLAFLEAVLAGTLFVAFRHYFPKK